MADSKNYEVSYEYTQELARKAASRSIWQQSGARILSVCYLATGCIVLLLMGKSGWYVSAGLAISFMCIVMWISRYWHAPAVLKHISDPTVTLRINDEGLEMHFAAVISKVAWSPQLRLGVFEDVWLLSFLGSRSFTPISSNALTNDMKDFFRRKVVENGGTIV